MKKLNGGLELVPGYKFSNIECGIRYPDRLDYSIIFSQKECNAAAVFTQNMIKAAPVTISMTRKDNKIRAIIINATNANACTGDEGERNALRLSQSIAEGLGVNSDQILLASTGIIGQQLPVEKMLESHKKLLAKLSVSEGKNLPKAIMTTDTTPKAIALEFTCGSQKYRIAGTAKGSGMIAPNMATLLSFIITDAPIAKEELQKIFKEKIDSSFNSLTIDGDTSTNDTAIILSPANGTPLSKPEDLKEFSSALEEVLSHLSHELVRDGEGVNHVVEINVKGALSSHEAETIAKSVARSLLVKTAIFGKDPNWGRIACAAGYSGARVEGKKLSIFYDDIEIFHKGSPTDFKEEELNAILNKTFYTITLDMGLEDGSARILTSDLSYEYVKINAEYST